MTARGRSSRWIGRGDNDAADAAAVEAMRAALNELPMDYRGIRRDSGRCALLLATGRSHVALPLLVRVPVPPPGPVRCGMMCGHPVAPQTRCLCVCLVMGLCLAMNSAPVK